MGSATAEVRPFLLYTVGRGWWKPNSDGFTHDLAEAGVYSEEEADFRVENMPRVRKERVSEQVQTRLEKGREQVAALEQLLALAGVSDG